MEEALVRQAVGDLESLGYAPIFTQVRLGVGKTSRARADIVAWSVDEGRLRPALVVEVKVHSRSDDFAQLASYANAAGVQKMYVFNGDWHAAVSNLRPDEISSPPSAEEPHGRDVTITREHFRDLLSADLWSRADELRNLRLPEADDFIAALDNALERYSLAPTGSVAWGALDVIRALGERARGSATVPEALAQAMAALLDASPPDSVIDPECGDGTLLLAVATLLGHTEAAALVGFERDPSNAAIADAVLRSAGLLGEIQTADLVATGNGRADRLISVLRASRLAQPVGLRDGTLTRDHDLVLLDRVPELLSPGGRAVVALMRRGLLSAGGAARGVRDRLASELHVASIISLPPRVFTNTAVAPVLLVLNAAPSAETLVADLGDDWEHQLSPDGEFAKTLTQHMASR